MRSKYCRPDNSVKQLWWQLEVARPQTPRAPYARDSYRPRSSSLGRCANRKRIGTLDRGFIGVAVCFWSTGPGPVFWDYKGHFRPFSDLLRLQKNRLESL